MERQQTGSGGSGAGASGAGASGAGSGVGGTGVGGTSAGSSGSGGVTSGAGGVAGSAGNAAGGAGGTTGGAGGAGGSPGVGCTGTELFCEDFEDDAEGVAPGAPWLAIPQHCETPDFSTEVTSEKAYTGTKSFKATNKTNYVECRSSAAFGDADEFWLRAFIWWNADVDFSGKELLAIDLHGQSGIGIDGPTVRFGSRMKEPCTASAGPQITLMAIAGGEQTGCTGTIQEPKNDWYCFEAHVTQPDGVSVKTYINGAGFQYESSGKAPTDTIDTPPDLTAVEKMKYVRIGIFSNSSATGAVYVDDLAIATTRLGCGTPVSP